MNLLSDSCVTWQIPLTATITVILVLICLFFSIKNNAKREEAYRKSEAALAADAQREKTVRELYDEIPKADALAPEQAVELFFELCRKFVGADEVSFDCGVCSKAGEERFCISLVRGFRRTVDDFDNNLQMVLAFYFMSDEENIPLSQSISRGEGEVLEEELALEQFFGEVKSSAAYKYLCEHEPLSREALIEEIV